MEAARSVEPWGLGQVSLGIVVAFLASNVIGAVIFSLAGWSSTADIPMWGFGVLQIPLWTVYLVVVARAAASGSGLRNAFGLSVRVTDPLMGVVIGVICQLFVLPALYAPIFRLTGTDSEELSRPARELSSRAQGSLSWVLFAVLVGLAAPVIEELFFRGLLLRSLSKRGHQRLVAVVGSAAIFAALHFQTLQFAGLFVFGLVLATLAVVTGRLGPSIFAHVGFNATTVVVLYLDYRSRVR